MGASDNCGFGHDASLGKPGEQGIISISGRECLFSGVSCDPSHTDQASARAARCGRRRFQGEPGRRRSVGSVPISTRSGRQTGVLVLLAQDGEKPVCGYGNAAVRKEDPNDEILGVIECWKRRTGHRPAEPVCGSRLTPYGNLNRLSERGIEFIPLRRRDARMLREIHRQPLSAWGRAALESVSRAYRTPGILRDAAWSAVAPKVS